MFKNNVGGIDRILRVAVGLAALALFFILPEAGWRWFLLLGLVPLATGALGSCPLYTIFGLSTCPVRKG